MRKLKILAAVLGAALMAGLSFNAFAAGNIGRTVTWEEIPDLVKTGNPTWEKISGSTKQEKEVMTAACAAFQEEFYKDVELIDEELEQIRMRRAELRELNGSTVIDGKGTTAAQQIALETENERILKESRRQVVLSVAAVITPEKYALYKAEENLQPQLEAIVESVQEIYISRQQLIAQQESMNALLEAEKARAKAVSAAALRGLASESDNAQIQLSLSRLQLQAESLDKSIRKLDRSLKTSLGIDVNEQVLFGPVPKADETYVRGIDYEADLKKVLENNTELRESEGEKNYKKFGDAKLQSDEVNRIRTELTSSMENAYRELKDEQTAYAAAMKGLSTAETQLKLKEELYKKGCISQLELLEEKAACQEARTLASTTGLGYKKAEDKYRRLTDIKVTDPNAGPGTVQ